MKTVRENVFETNSSSMHAIVIPKFGSCKEIEGPLVFNYCMDFSDRMLVIHDKAEDKASYIFQLIVNHFCNKFKPVDNSAETEEYNEFVLKVFEYWMEYFKKCVKCWRKMDVEFTGYEIEREHKTYRGDIEKRYNIVEPINSYASTGCYGHAGFVGIMMNSMFKKIDEAISCHDLAYYVNQMDDPWDSDILNIIDFVTNPNAVIIQCTDEYTNEEFAEMKATIKKYMEKNDYCCHVVWPVGG